MAPPANLQIFGTRKYPDTRKAERWFKERRVPFQIIDVAEKGPSPGELRKIAAAVGVEALIDRDGRRSVERAEVRRAHGAAHRAGVARRSAAVAHAIVRSGTRGDG